jgi:hypothetical protein
LLVVWRSGIVAGYLAFAIVVGVTYGLRGFAILCFFYFCATAWMAFLLPWGSLARAAGRSNVRRLETPRSEERPHASKPPPNGDLQPVPDAVAVPPETLLARTRRRRPAPAV